MFYTFKYDINLYIVFKWLKSASPVLQIPLQCVNNLSAPETNNKKKINRMKL